MIKQLSILVGCLCAPVLFLHAQAVEEFVAFKTEGATRVVITDPSGSQTGSHGYHLYQEGDNTEMVLAYDVQDIRYSRPELGEYAVSFRAARDEDYEFTLYYYDGLEYQEYEMRRWVSEGEVSEMTITLSHGDEGFEFDSSEAVPPHAYAQYDAGKMRLWWEKVEGAVSYRVYAKYWDYPYFHLLGETSGTEYATDYDWARDSGDPLHPTGLYYFAVTALLANGNETVFSPLVSNADRDNDGYNDFREEAMGTDIESDDSDGDGLSDFLERNRYYTNPLEEDSDGDGFTDGDEVEAGTLPNQRESYPGRVDECGAPKEGDWHVSSDCTVLEDQDIPADLIVHPDSLLTIREQVTMWFDYTRHKILVMFGGGIHLQRGAQIKQQK